MDKSISLVVLLYYHLIPKRRCRDKYMGIITTCLYNGISSSHSSLLTTCIVCCIPARWHRGFLITSTTTPHQVGLFGSPGIGSCGGDRSIQPLTLESDGSTYFFAPSNTCCQMAPKGAPRSCSKCLFVHTPPTGIHCKVDLNQLSMAEQNALQNADENVAGGGEYEGEDLFDLDDVRRAIESQKGETVAMHGEINQLRTLVDTISNGIQTFEI